MVAAVSKGETLPIRVVKRKIMNKRPTDAEWTFKCRLHHYRLDFTISISTTTKGLKTIKMTVHFLVYFNYKVKYMPSSVAIFKKKSKMESPS